MINYAHRGASEYAPENTLSAFYLGLMQGANGIETDVRRTKDGILVLFHDGNVDRVSDNVGSFSEYTYEALCTLKIYGNNTTGFYDRIVTFKEFLEKFSGYDIQFAIELKGEGVEKDTLDMVKQFGIMGRTTFTSFNFDYIRKIKELDSKARVGWLVNDITDENIKRLCEIGGEELAPAADRITEENIKKLRDLGLGVRAWGVSNVGLMKKMCEVEVDGMTVNFPDRLFQYLSKAD